jgi:NADH:ubiquinone oxidoreductase subunit F (NADH-binding)
MVKNNIIEKLKDSGLVGRGGACFPVWLKWKMTKDAKGEKKYVVCNASEGEPGIAKDLFLLENHAEGVIEGMKLAIEFLGAERGYIYLNPRYHKKLAKKLTAAIGNLPIEILKKSHAAGYVGGEETSALNHIEGKRIEPRVRPPFPPTRGLWGCPTLVNNVETFYAVGLVNGGKYEHKRFYTINGDCLWTGVYELPEDWTIVKILKETANYPKFDFFAQIGGDASGEVLNSTQLDKPAGGGGSITIYSTIKYQPLDLMKKWIDFFCGETCGQCTPCREGTYRLHEILNSPEPNWEMFAQILETLRDTAFCGLGCAVPVPLRSYVENVLSAMPGNKIKLPKNKEGRMICECFR